LHPHHPRNQRFSFNVSLARRSLAEGGNALTIQRFHVAKTFPHNLALVSVLYISERPEMTTQ
jgi:hypothetical protein